MFNDCILTIGINAELKNNNNGQTKHWSTSHREKKVMINALQNAIILHPENCSLSFLDFRKEIMVGSFNQKVDLTIKRILGKGQRFFDPDSILRGNCKQLVDALTSEKILKDDSSKHIGRVLGLQCANQRTRGPSIEVSFWKHENESSISSTGSALSCDSPVGL